MATFHTPLLLLATLATTVFSQGCMPRDYGENSFVCVCNSTYCDFPGSRPTPSDDNYVRVVSSRDRYRFNHFSGVQDTNATGDTLIVVEHFLPEEQTILGFGGSFTDAAGINIVNLTDGAQDMLMRSYYASEGIQYNMARVPIGGSDFSTYAYTYDEVWNDVNLTYFSLTVEDYIYKIPLILEALTLSNNELKILGTPWSPPPWMKTNEMHNESGILKPSMWEPFSHYMIRFIQDYEAEGVPIWGVTPQNEPLTGFSDHPWNTCGWTPEAQRDWIRDMFGPNMTTFGYENVSILVYDHNRDAIPLYPATILNDTEARNYVAGTAVHWYNDHITGPEVLDQLHEGHPDKFILYTESCAGWTDGTVRLGYWDRAENYAYNILEDLNHHSVGWIDWNLALDTGGGPNWANNTVDSPIIIDLEADEFLKQPMFYAMGHFSKYVQRGGKRIPTVVSGNPEIYAASFHNPDGEEVVVILNRGDADESISIETHAGGFINFIMNAKSIESVIYQSNE